MPVFLLTFHAYRSWSENNPRGFVERGKQGVRPPHRGLARARNKLATHRPRRFGRAQQRCIIESARDIATRRTWRLHAASVTPTHVHVLVSWSESMSPADVTTVFKRILGMTLSHAHGTKGNRWFSAGADRKRVRDREHLSYLIEVYLPKHVDEGGTVWVES